ncbi:MAG: hypothetical protein R3B84_23405 [Zavarzinella sp.]
MHEVVDSFIISNGNVCLASRPDGFGGKTAHSNARCIVIANGGFSTDLGIDWGHFNLDGDLLVASEALNLPFSADYVY